MMCLTIHAMLVQALITFLHIRNSYLAEALDNIMEVSWEELHKTRLLQDLS